MAQTSENEITIVPERTRKGKKKSLLSSLFTYLIMIVPMAAIFLGGLWNYSAIDLHKTQALLSPIPDFLRISENRQVTLLDLWSPMVQKSHGSTGSSEMSDLTAQGILMYDLTTDKVLYERDAKVRRPMASVTKIMTAIVAIENQRSDNRYIVSPEDIVGENSMGVTPGEVFTMEELLYGLMLPSGNDAAEVLANNYPNGHAAFVQAMNDKAKAIGAVDTRFSNPSGLQGDGEQYTTPYDLVVITRYALDKHPIFGQVVATATHEIVPTDKHSAYSLVNETNLLTTYQGVKGVKTGYTPEAGLCLVTYLEYGNHKIIGVVLNSQNRRGEMKQLLDYSLKSVGIEPPPFEEPI